MITTLLRPRQGPTIPPTRYADQHRGVSLLAGLPSTGGLRVNEDNALTISAVWACVRLISNTVMSMPFQVRRPLPAGGNEDLSAAPARRLLHHRANPFLSGPKFRQIMQAWALCWPQAYAEIELDRELNPVALWPIGPDRVTPRWNDRGEIEYVVDGRVTIPYERMFVLQGLSWDGLEGYSLVKAAAVTMGLTKAAERYTAQFFANMARPGLAITFPEALKPNEKTAVKTMLGEEFGQPAGGAFKPIALDHGAKIDTITANNDDAQLDSVRRFNVVEICRWFGVTPFHIGHLEGAAYNNVEQQMLQFREAIMPWAVTWESEVDHKLLGPADSDDESRPAYAHLNLNGLLRADARTRAEFYDRMTKIGAMNINEVRDREDMNPIEGGEMHLIPVNNMAPLDTVRPMAEAEIEAKRRGAQAPRPPASGTRAPTPEETPAQIAERHTLALHEIAVETFAGLEKVDANIAERHKGAERRQRIEERQAKVADAVRPVVVCAMRAALAGLGVPMNRAASAAAEAVADEAAERWSVGGGRLAEAGQGVTGRAASFAVRLLETVALEAARHAQQETAPCSPN